MHVHEPECAVKQAVEKGKNFTDSVMKTYVSFYEELKEQEKREILSDVSVITIYIGSRF